MNNIPCDSYALVSQKIYNLQRAKWIEELERDSARRGEGGNKLRTYRTFKHVYEIEPYVEQLLPPRHRRAIAQFRAGVAPIRLETGRYERGRLPIHERVCFMCTTCVEDETHVILKCPLYSDLREDLVRQCIESNPNFTALCDSEKLAFILSHHSIVRTSARILYKILQRRQDIFSK
jgi:hypothetical protein